MEFLHKIIPLRQEGGRVMETLLVTGLTVIIAFGIITVAALALANVVGIRIHDHERYSNGGDRLYYYLSDDAQELRQLFRKLPGWFRNRYLIFNFLVIISIAYGLSCSKESKVNSPLSDPIFQEQGIVLFVLAMVAVYKFLVVIRTTRISSHLYRVLRDV